MALHHLDHPGLAIDVGATDAGVFNPTSLQVLNQAPDGANVGYANDATLRQE